MLHSSLSESARVILSGIMCRNVQCPGSYSLRFFSTFFIFCALKYLSCKNASSPLSESARVILSGIMCRNVQCPGSYSLRFFSTFFIFCALKYLSGKNASSPLSESARVISSGIMCRNVQCPGLCCSTLFLNFFHILRVEVFKRKKCLLVTVLWWSMHGNCCKISLQHCCKLAINCSHLTFKHLVLCPASKLDWCENSVNTQFGFINGYYA